jgi:hypothetical protein
VCPAGELPLAGAHQFIDQGSGGILDVQQADVTVLHLGVLTGRHLVGERRHERVVGRPAVLAEEIRQDHVGEG